MSEERKQFEVRWFIHGEAERAAHPTWKFGTVGSKDHELPCGDEFATLAEARACCEALFAAHPDRPVMIGCHLKKAWCVQSRYDRLSGRAHPARTVTAWEFAGFRSVANLANLSAAIDAVAAEIAANDFDGQLARAQAAAAEDAGVPVSRWVADCLEAFERVEAE